MKICVVTPLYAIAGVPLAQARFARALARQGHEVDLVIGHVVAGCQLSPVEGVRTIVLAAPNVRSMLWPLMRYLRAERPDVVFSAEDHLNAVVLLAAILTGVKAKISGSSRVTPFDTYSRKPFTKRWLLKLVVRALMWRADVLSCVSADMVLQYRQVFRDSPHVCIYNIVVDERARALMHEPVDHPWLSDKSMPLVVAAGRLAPWKGFNFLIQAFKLASEKKESRLLILGDGPLRDDLERQIDEAGLTGRVQLLGYVANPLKFFSRADVFVLSSLVEGLPNVLVEAMMCGCTPVATDCPTGPREVLQDGQIGHLVPVADPSALADGILAALANPAPRQQLTEAVRPFEERAVLARHFQLLGVPV